MRKTAWIAMLALLVATQALMGAEYNLVQCLEMARKTDPDLVRFREAVKTAGSEVWYKAGQLLLPSLSASASYSKVDQGSTAPSSISTTDKGYTAGILLEYNGINLFEQTWEYLKSRANRKGADYTYAAAASDLTLLVKTRYYLALKYRRDLEVAQEAVKRSEELLKLFEGKYELGSASLSEVLKQKVQYGNDQLTLVTAERDYQAALDYLALTIGLSPDDEFDVAEIELTRDSVPALTGLIAKASQTHPTVLAARQDVTASRYDVQVAYSRFLPTLSVGYSFSRTWNRDSFDDLVKFGAYDHTGMFQIGLSLDIFDRFSRMYQMSQAKAGLTSARANEVYTKNQIIKDIRDAHIGIRLAEQTLSVTEETERAAREDMDLVQAKYELGAAALWELLDAQVSLKEAQFGRVTAEFDYNLAMAKLQNAMGE